jgi:hypothetical protein
VYCIHLTLEELTTLAKVCIVGTRGVLLFQSSPAFALISFHQDGDFCDEYKRENIEAEEEGEEQ